MDAASQAVVKLTPDFVGFDSARQPSSPQQGTSGENNYQRNQFHFGRPHHDQSGGNRNYIPKLSFPRFDGRHPKI